MYCALLCFVLHRKPHSVWIICSDATPSLPPHQLDLPGPALHNAQSRMFRMMCVRACVCVCWYCWLVVSFTSTHSLPCHFASLGVCVWNVSSPAMLHWLADVCDSIRLACCFRVRAIVVIIVIARGIPSVNAFYFFRLNRISSPLGEAKTKTTTTQGKTTWKHCWCCAEESTLVCTPI